MDFFNLKRQQRVLEASLRARIDKVLAHGQYIMGPEVAELEEALCALTGAAHCVACASGTDALLMALMARGVGPGDAVFTPSFTFIATAEVIALLGATPVFVDIDPRTFNLDPARLETAVGDLLRGRRPSPGSPPGLRPKAVIPVDLFGLPADYDAIRPICARHGLFLLEDAAQSLGAAYRGRPAGTLGDAAAVSFFPSKPLGAYGDGGAVFTGDGALAETLQSIRLHGKGADKYDNVRIGLNGRLDTLQAAVLLAKLETFPAELRRRREAAGIYTADLAGLVATPHVPEGCASAWAQYSVLSPNRAACLDRLRAAGVPAMIYYPKPLHRQTAFAALAYGEGALPESEKAAAEIFSIPLHAYLEKGEQARVVAALRGT